MRYWDYLGLDAHNIALLERSVYSVPYLIYLPLSLFGLIFLIRKKGYWTLTFLKDTVVVYWLPHVFLIGRVRMRMCTEFILIILAAMFISQVLRWIHLKNGNGIKSTLDLSADTAIS